MGALLAQIEAYIMELSTFGKIAMTFLISMVPVIELRGAIPIAAHAGLPWYVALAASIAGSMLPVPFVLLFIRAIFAWVKKKRIKFLCGFVDFLERRATKKMDKVVRYETFGLIIFVAVPLPGTGAWTGSVIAAMMELRLKNAVPAIAVGVVTAGIIMTVISYGVKSVLGT